MQRQLYLSAEGGQRDPKRPIVYLGSSYIRARDKLEDFADWFMLSSAFRLSSPLLLFFHILY